MADRYPSGRGVPNAMSTRLDVFDSTSSSLSSRPSKPVEEKKPAVQLANPSPFGLFGFAIASWMFGMLKMVPAIIAPADAPIDALLAAVAVFMGGIAPVIAGLIHFSNRNTYPATVFLYANWFSPCFSLPTVPLSLSLYCPRVLTFTTPLMLHDRSFGFFFLPSKGC